MKIIPCIWMDAEAEEAAAFYRSTFSNGGDPFVARYPESTDNPSGKPKGSVVTVDDDIGGLRFTLLNGGPQFRPNPSVSFYAQVASADEVERLHATLMKGGKELMPLGAYPWSERYAWVQDRFGVSWQLMVDDGVAALKVIPCLMFSGPVGGKAEEAMETYTRIFPKSEVESVSHYGEGEGPKGWVNHGRFRLGAQPLVAMDSHVEHAFNFDEGVSIQVHCDDQREIDACWSALTEGGEPGVCGWLTDRFGLRWQILPAAMDAWMSSEDTAAKDRAFNALMQMKKIDVGALERAFQGASDGMQPSA